MTPFILTGFPRTGTTVVAASIIDHPEILFYGEIFSTTPEVRVNEARRLTLGAGWQMDKRMGYELKPLDYRASAAPYLEQFWAHQLPFRALGFKIMLDQAVEGPNSDVWRYIADHPEVRIVRTRRSNLMEVVCSYARARVTRRWHTSGESMPEPQFIISPDEFANLVRRFTAVPEAFQGVEATHPVLDLDYDRISSDFSGCMRDVYHFLGVSKRDVPEPRLKKIAKRAPREELVNYDELKQHFAGTELARYFD